MDTHLVSIGLPPVLVDFLQTVASVTNGSGYRFFLVGGMVRDLLIAPRNSRYMLPIDHFIDLDLLIEGDAIAIAHQVASQCQLSLSHRTPYGTAKIAHPILGLIDFASTRIESYPEPGGNPHVQFDTLEADLFRRDFTVNAMAIRLDGNHWGELIDFYGGQDHLQAKCLRILHDKSFEDDPTRLWRGLRLAERLGFHLDEWTLDCAQRTLQSGLFDNWASDRLCDEFRRLFQETQSPKEMLARLADLGALRPFTQGAVTSRQDADDVLSAISDLDAILRDFPQALEREKNSVWLLYLALLMRGLNEDRFASLCHQLHLHSGQQELLRRCRSTVSTFGYSQPYSSMSGSELVAAFRPHSVLLLLYACVTADDEGLRRAIARYWSELLPIRLEMTGKDLIAMGLRPGPKMKIILGKLLAEKQDGTIATSDDERIRAGQLIRELLIDEA